MGYLTAFFNSQLFRFAFKERFPELLGDTRELSKVFFEDIPVKQVDDIEEKQYLLLIEQIQKLIENRKDYSFLRTQIEDKLADLYNLTQIEKSVIRYKI